MIYHYCLALVSCLLLALFVIVPVARLGIVGYLAVLNRLPILRYFVNSYVGSIGKRISKEWLSKIKILSENELPHIDWENGESVLDQRTPFYILDQKSDDIRCIINNKIHNYPHDAEALWNSHFTNEFIFVPEIAPSPSYNYEINNDTLSIRSNDELENWVYLLSKEKYPAVYALDFMFKTGCSLDETLQIDFNMKSLASRLRFIVKNNNDVRFDVVERGFFLSSFYEENYSQFKRPCSLTLNEYHHVRFEKTNNCFALWIDDELQMGVSINAELEDGHWCLIFWNGLERNDMISIDIKNFRVLYPQV